MPELPEVETIVRDLQRVVGRTIQDVVVSWPGSIAGNEPAELAALVRGRRIERLGRRAKNILIWLAGDLVLLIHLRMTGRLLLGRAGTPEERFQRAALLLDDGGELRFADVRKFGRLKLLQGTALDELDVHLGPEPLSDDFTPAILRDRLHGRRGRLKPLLLDQRFLAGIGNIYADEALFAAGLHPTVSIESLTADAVSRLHCGLRKVLRDAIDNRGTSFSDYLDGLGRPGANQDQLMVYRRTGQPCLVCGAIIERVVLSGRGTHYCPRCQRTAARRP